MTFHIFVNFLIVLLSYGRVKDKDVFNKDQISSGRAKGRGKRGGMGGESLNEGYFYKIPIIKQDTNFISQTFGQKNSQPLPLQSACPKTFMQGFSSDFEQFFLVQNNFICIF